MIFIAFRKTSLIIFNSMGNYTCCQNNQQQLDLHLGPDDNLYQQRFFHFYPQAETAFKSIIFPKNYQKIQIDKMTQFKQQGVFLGKERCRVRSGLGIMIYEAEGFLYIGNWVNNNMQGLGYMVFKDGSYYQGEFYLNKPHGYGEYYNLGKTWIFKGKWKSGVKQGQGQQTYPDGAVFKGNYHNDLKEGQGSIIFPNLCKYDDRQRNKSLHATSTSSKPRCLFKGTFKNDVATGHGVQKGQDYKYDGQWQNNQMNGAGTATYYNENGEPIEHYIGEFKDGLKDGFGEYRWADGRVYKGQWSKGEMTSQGVFIDKRQ